MANKDVTGEVLVQNYKLQKKFNEFFRQINQVGGYPFNFEDLENHLQDAIVGNFQKRNMMVSSTGINLRVYAHPEFNLVSENSIIEFMKPVIEREKKRNNLNPYPFFSFTGFLLNLSVYGKIIPGFETFCKEIFYFTKHTTQNQILGSIDFYNFHESMAMIREAILHGEVDKLGVSISSFFEINDTKYRLSARRDKDSKLFIVVFDTKNSYEWGPGHRIIL